MKKPPISFNKLNAQISTIKSALCSLKKKGFFGIENFSVFQSPNKKNIEIKVQVTCADKENKIVFYFNPFLETGFDDVKKQIEQVIEKKVA
ncbi:MAG: hypothetical protein QMD50_02470 [Patescibacteria group bacterium]|nr:hypothetical protein [Patescibacteria group bacterium]